MSKMRLESCPFCKAKVKDEWPTVTKISSHRWNVYHSCNQSPHDMGVIINVYGSTKKEAVDRWNHRAGEVVDG